MYYNGYHGDCSKTFLIGKVDPLGQHLVKVTEECLYKGIEVCGPNVPYSEIGNAVEQHAQENGLEVIREFIGHGIGTYFHGLPEICHYRKSGALNDWTIDQLMRKKKQFSIFIGNKHDGRMMSGMTFTIEPILCLGRPKFKILGDDWTAVTKDDSRTAQFEHTILVTGSGAEILTIPDSIQNLNDK